MACWPSRRGTVMIMVVGLLVLLALMGTAYIASVQTDRVAARVNTLNTTADLLLEGLKDLAVAPILDDLYGRDTATMNGPYLMPRPQGDKLYTFAPVDSHMPSSVGPDGKALTDSTPAERLCAHSDNYLAARCPDGTSDPTPIPYWPAVSSPLASRTDVIGAASQGIQKSLRPFESPQNGTTYYDRLNLRPTSINLTVNGVTTPFPALQAGGQIYLAADADGDGIADSGLWPVPTGTNDGLKWYYAIRIVDNNSAVNTTTAFRPYSPGEDASAVPACLFPSHVDLQGMMKGADGTARAAAMTALNNYRANGVTAGTYSSVPEALWMQLGRRPANPDGTCRAFDLTDQICLAYRFGIRNINGTSQLETALGTTGAGPSVSRYSADAVNTWYQNFTYSGDGYNRRPLLVARNPVTTAILAATTTNPPADPTTPAVSGMTAYDLDRLPVKTSLNTAPFGELWRAYWNVMTEVPSNNASTANPDPSAFFREVTSLNIAPLADPYYALKFDQTPSLTPDNTGPKTSANPRALSPESSAVYKFHPSRMFRSSFRDYATSGYKARFDPDQMVLLRSAIAATNTIQLRNARSTQYWPQTIPLKLRTDTSTTLDLNLTIYGVRPQPFITEVYYQTDTRTITINTVQVQNKNGYHAVELYNPYDTAISLANWKVGYVSRKTGATRQISSLSVDFGSSSIPSQGYVVLENYQAGNSSDTNAAHYRPQALTAAQNTAIDNARIYVKDLHLAVGAELVLLRPSVDGQATADLSSMVPADSYDSTGIPPITDSGATATSPPQYVARHWHYVRKSQGRWNCLYPGRYWGNTPAAASTDTTSVGFRHQGIVERLWYPNPNTGTRPPRVFQNEPATTINLGAESSSANYAPVFTIQYANTDMAGPYGDQSKFPYGGFMRVGDIMHVPFAAAYVMKKASDGSFYDLNTLPLDLIFAEDSDTTDDAYEQIGRFCPVWSVSAGGTTADDWDGATYTSWRYRWAMRIFDYFTVFAPQDDYTTAAPLETGLQGSPIANVIAGQANGTADKKAGVDGLININTAPWRVLATLPLASLGTGPGDPVWEANNATIARAIVRYRDGDGSTPGAGPFRSIFDLYRVPGITDPTNMPAATVADGDLTPINGSDSVKDYEDQFCFINRIANLVTLRSDTFTCYLLVQGWRTGTTTELVAQRRMGLIVDRTGVARDGRNLKVYPFALD